MTSNSFEEWQARLANGSVDIEALRIDINGLEAQVDAAETEFQARRAALDEMKADLQALLGLRNFLAHRSTDTSPARSSVPAPIRRRMSKRDAILSALAEGHGLHTTAIRKLLVDADEMGADQASYHSLQVVLSQMFRAGELERPARGVYRRR